MTDTIAHASVEIKDRGITETDAAQIPIKSVFQPASIEAICRPIMQAQRLLRDHQVASAAFNPRPTSDDAPDVGAISRAAEAVQAALSTAVTAESVEAIIERMAGGNLRSRRDVDLVAVCDQLLDAVIHRDALSLALDGPLPLAAVAIAVRKCRGAAVATGEVPSENFYPSSAPTPEQFLRDCIKERQDIETLLDALLDAEARMRGRR